MAVGPATEDITVGDRIVYGGYSNTEIKVGSEKYLLIKQENIYAKLV